MKTYKDIISYKFTKNDIRIAIVSDVHLGAIECNQQEWRRFCDIVKNTPDMYVILAGDLVNNSIAGSVGNPFDEVMRPSDQKRIMCDYLAPIKDRILCAVSGNHERRSLAASDGDITYDIMSKLDLEDRYRHDAAVVCIRLMRSGGGNDGVEWYIAVTHGTGSGTTKGSSVNKVVNWAANFEGLDIVVMGHTHKPAAAPRSVLYIEKRAKIVKKRDVFCIVASSWLEYGGYAVTKMLSPEVTAKPQILELHMERRADGGKDRCIKSTGISWRL